MKLRGSWHLSSYPSSSASPFPNKNPQHPCQFSQGMLSKGNTNLQSPRIFLLRMYFLIMLKLLQCSISKRSASASPVHNKHHRHPDQLWQRILIRTAQLSKLHGSWYSSSYPSSSASPVHKKHHWFLPAPAPAVVS